MVIRLSGGDHINVFQISTIVNAGVNTCEVRMSCGTTYTVDRTAQSLADEATRVALRTVRDAIDAVTSPTPPRRTATKPPKESPS